MKKWQLFLVFNFFELNNQKYFVFFYKKNSCIINKTVVFCSYHVNIFKVHLIGFQKKWKYFYFEIKNKNCKTSLFCGKNVNFLYYSNFYAKKRTFTTKKHFLRQKRHFLRQKDIFKPKNAFFTYANKTFYAKKLFTPKLLFYSKKVFYAKLIFGVKHIGVKYLIKKFVICL